MKSILSIFALTFLTTHQSLADENGYRHMNLDGDTGHMYWGSPMSLIGLLLILVLGIVLMRGIVRPRRTD